MIVATPALVMGLVERKELSFSRLRVLVRRRSHHLPVQKSQAGSLAVSVCC